MVYVVIFAGGVGHRMASDTPKQFLLIKEKPILVHTINIFNASPVVDRIVVVVLNNYLNTAKDLVKQYKLDKVAYVVAGGSSAFDSQFIGISKIVKELKPLENDIVIVHDGVRPFINDELIQKCVNTVRKYGSAITVSPASETVGVINKDKQIQYTLPRQDCYLARAPQCFYLKDLYQSHIKALKDKKTYIDSASMMLDQGYSLHPVEGPIENIKITTQYDYILAKLLLGDNN